MHLTIFLRPEDNSIVLPIHYNYIVQSAIYHSIDSRLAAFLHEKGFSNKERVFKMFSFSLLRGPFVIDKTNDVIMFSNSIQLIVSSPVDAFCQSLANTLLSRGHMRLGRNEVVVEKVYAQKYKVDKAEIVVKTLSPIVLYSTLLRPDGRKYTCYFQPGEPDYDRLLNGNLQKKYQAYYGKEPPTGTVQANALGRQKMSIVKYKGIIIKGYSGRLHLTGPCSLLQLAVDGGLGGKNAQGFGCVEMVGGK